MKTTKKKIKAFIFGAGATGRALFSPISEKYEVVGYLDNDPQKWNTSEQGLTVYRPNVLTDMDYGVVVIGTYVGLESLTQQILEMGIERDKIDQNFIQLAVKSRVVFIEKLSEVFEQRNIRGCVAEGGVFQGDFSKEINRVFPSSKMYLFDTFSGFDARDVKYEKNKNYSELGAGHFNITSEELVLSKLPHPEMCVIRKGYFPESAEGLDEVFCFVNLDFDLYQPILAGLEYFYPRMVEGGIIVIHEYFSNSYKGVKVAVQEFESRVEGLRLFPIGDGLSLGILC